MTHEEMASREASPIELALQAAGRAIENGSEYVDGYQVELVTDDPTKPDSLFNRKRSGIMHVPGETEPYPRGSRTPATPAEVVAYAERLNAEAKKAAKLKAGMQAGSAALLAEIGSVKS